MNMAWHNNLDLKTAVSKSLQVLFFPQDYVAAFTAAMQFQGNLDLRSWKHILKHIFVLEQTIYYFSKIYETYNWKLESIFRTLFHILIFFISTLYVLKKWKKYMLNECSLLHNVLENEISEKSNNFKFHDQISFFLKTLCGPR